jgi:CRISPR-associated protein Csm4
MEYTIKIALQSSVITPFQSDTLFGHICWAIRYLWGEKYLVDFLNQYHPEKTPPLFISNGFPDGYLPKPILLPVSQGNLDKILLEDRVSDSYKIKSIKKADLVSISILKRLQGEAISPKGLFREMYKEYKDKNYDAVMDVEKSRINMTIRRNTVNRIKNKVEEGLYDQEEFFCHEGSNIFCIYMRSDRLSRDKIERIFKFIGKNGFGKDKNTGKGHFEVESIEEKIDLPEWENPNSFMTLSSFIPAETDPTKGYYKVLKKHGKLGGMYTHGNPFKRPLLMFQAGSVFFDEPVKSNYGSLLPGVHRKHKDVLHYAYAFPIGLRIEGI